MTRDSQRGFTSAFVAAALAATLSAAAGCSSDPNGGSTGTGGAGGKATAGGTGGAASVSLGAITGTALQTFDAAGSVNGFMLSNYTPADGETNLAVAAPSAAMTTITWNASEGSPGPGALQINAAFSDWNQWVEVNANTQMPLLDWTGKKLHVRLKVGSGFGSDMYAQGGAQILVDSTTSYVQVNAGQMIPLGNQWQEFTIDLSTATAAGFMANQVITYGIHIYSGSGNPTAAKPTPAVLYVDSFSLE